MSNEVLFECSFLIPVRRDSEFADGGFHSLEAWDWLTGQLYDHFDGWTRASQLCEGQWKSPKTGKPIADQSHEYRVALPEGRIDILRAILAQACVIFSQQVIYLSIAGRVEFIEAPHNGPTN